jgi:Tfp pilus assembly protein FimT
LRPDLSKRTMHENILANREVVRAATPGCRGYTVLELLIGMAVVLLMGMIAIPQLVAVTEEYRLSAVAREVTGNISDARIRAITSNADYRVVVSDSDTYVIEEDVAGTWTNRATHDMPDGFTIGATGATVQFHRWGNATPVASFSITNGNGTAIQAVTTTSGRSYVQ